ncbi:DUF3231 family protein [Paenibacillus validus]|uniref:DUF3231 family protein n=3 Tax=Paenibacillus validus TaxID=44253 RepID=A0A7X3CT02_9BACL|nr:DUF3231 family protein [Paenibacillus validus]
MRGLLCDGKRMFIRTRRFRLFEPRRIASYFIMFHDLPQPGNRLIRCSDTATGDKKVYLGQFRKESRYPLPAGFRNRTSAPKPSASAYTRMFLMMDGLALGVSMRRDINTNYYRLMLEVSKFAENGAEIMMNNRWLEKPPSAVDRKALARL